MEFESTRVLLGELSVGAVIDGFRLVGEFRSGGTAFLFRVERVDDGPDGRPSTPLLMKLPRVGRDQPPESILGFETEATIMSALHGTHFPRFFASGDLAQTPYLVMELVSGVGLGDIAKNAPLPVDDIVNIGASLADGVHAMHMQDAIHHDLKPDNVIVRDDGTAVLIDFGFSQHAHFPDLLAEEARFAAGSAPYVSPEQLTGVRNDPRGDIFALGVVLYELTTARLPFGIPDNMNAMRNRLWATPVPPRARNEACPAWLQEIILRCLEPDALVRYQTAAHVAFDLRHPEQVLLTARATRTTRPGFWTQFRLWWRSREDLQSHARKPISHVSRSPVIMVAVDTSHPDDVRHPALQWTAQQLASLNLEFRMICVSAIGGDSSDRTIEDVRGIANSSSGRQLIHLARLRNWIDPLGISPDRVSLHVMESSDPAETLLAFAKNNNVDLIVLGAPASHDARLAWWRSVASTVTANAPCSVHVVRVPTRPREDWLRDSPKDEQR